MLVVEILFNADDYGLTKSITDGIIKAHKDGVVNSATMMMNGHATNYAIEQAKQNPSLKVGIHLVLSWGKPLSQTGIDSLTNEAGYFKYDNTFESMHPPNPDDVMKEWTAQIKSFLATGLSLNHIDSHHHTHGWDPLKDVIILLAKRYDVPVRYVDSLKDYPHLLLTETLWTDFYADGVDRDIFNKLRSLDVSSVEVMTHPSFVDEDLKSVSSYIEKRKEELDILTSLTVPSWAKIL